MIDNGRDSVPPPPSALVRGPWLRRLSFFGPGAIIASLTIGTGELIFSARGGAIFGYRILWLFVLISVLKWALVYATSRHMVLSGAHPFERWAALPGPRGWFPMLFLLLAIPCFPIFVGFHAGVIGSLAHWLWGANAYPVGAAALVAIVLLALAGGYNTLERVQLLIVSAMLLCAGAALLMLGPDWWALVKGIFVPQPLAYPPWLAEAAPTIAARPVWVETTVYVSVIGGASYDYLAYVSFVREKRWGFAGMQPATPAALDAVGADRNHPARQWLRAARIDSAVSFAAVILFTILFVAAGAVVLGPRHLVPTELDMLNHQSELLTSLHRWLKPLYIAGASLTMLGTLYGTIEVAPRVLQELANVVAPRASERQARRLRTWAILWCGVGGMGVVLRMWAYGQDDLVAVVTPAALFTGVLSCGFVCLLAPWADRRFLPRGLRMGWGLLGLNLVAGLVFIGLGLKSYRDYAAARDPQVLLLAVGGLIGAMVLAGALASWFAIRAARAPSDE